MSKHTPGPWRVFDAQSGAPPGIESISKGSALGATIIVCSENADTDDAGIRGRTEEETIANANLIAAAPEMYEALKEAQASICGLCRVINLQHKDCPSCDEIEFYRAALAKAEGRT